LKDAVSDLKLGDPLEESTDVGPLIRASDTERVRAWIEEATEGGGCRVVGGGVEGEILEPTIVDATPRDCRLWREEVFGPVCAVRSYSTFDEGIALANDTEMPIHAGLFTRDLSRALAAVRELRFGGVLVNEVPTFRTDQQPYGGVREAGNTREGPAYAARELTEVRFVSLEP
jgi:acyl-CoA reductase-like NAD-dependent aldehyde dehydrogenase